MQTPSCTQQAEVMIVVVEVVEVGEDATPGSKADWATTTTTITWTPTSEDRRQRRYPVLRRLENTGNTFRASLKHPSKHRHSLSAAQRTQHRQKHRTSDVWESGHELRTTSLPALPSTANPSPSAREPANRAPLESRLVCSLMDCRREMRFAMGLTTC